MEILILFILLQVKHMYADFKFQTYRQTVHKGIYRDLIGISHSLEHVLATLVALMVFCIWVPLSASEIAVIAILEGIVHYHIDWIKAKWGSKDSTNPLFWSQFGLDQLAHQFTYGAIMWYVMSTM